MKLYFGREQALIIQNYDSLALLLEQAFGPSKSSSQDQAPAKVVSTLAEMQAAIGSIFGGT